MSLFDLDEICEGCLFAVFHNCCESFCRCKAGVSDYVDNATGKCAEKMKEYDNDSTK